MKAAILAVFVLIPCATPSVRAETFRVDTTETGNTAALRLCDDAADGDCSFHGALTRANATPEADVVAFDIPAASDSGCVGATGVCRVYLPQLGCGGFTGPFVVTAPLLIDGLTQPGASANTLPADGHGVDMQPRIELVRSGYCRSGLRFETSATIRGVAINQVAPVGGQTLPFLHFAGRDAAETYRVESSIIGGFADGTALAGDATIFNPILVSDCFQCLGDWRNEAHIGGELPAQRNWLISGAPAIKVEATYDSPSLIGTEALIRGNLFGTNRSGNAAGFEPTTVEGWINVNVGSDARVQVGGPAPAARNVFATTIYPAIAPAPLSFPSTMGAATLVVQGNHFGLGADGLTPLSVRSQMYDRGGQTLRLARATIGGTETGEGNRFVSLYPTFIIESLGANQILANEFIGTISLGLIEDTARSSFGRVNDAGDADQHPTSGAVQNWPEILAFDVDGNQLVLDYRVDTLPANAVYPLTIEFYRADANNAAQFLGRDTYAAAEAGTTKSIVLPLPLGHALDSESMIIATANQSAHGGVSSFSWAPVSLIFTGNAPAIVDEPATVSVRLQALGPFRPRGRVEISDGPGNPLAQRCIATLAPSATSPFRAEGQCSLTWQQAGSRTLTATYLDLHESFHADHGGTPTAARLIEIQSAPAGQGPMFCDGFEDVPGCTRR